MQAFGFNGLVPNHRQENFFLPNELAAVVDPLVMRYGKKKKWAVYAAALIALFGQDEMERDALVERVSGARTVPGGMDRLLAKLPQHADPAAKRIVKVKGHQTRKDGAESDTSEPKPPPKR